MRSMMLALVVSVLLGTVPATASASVARGGQQCLPRPAQESLVVRGAVTCGKVEGFLPKARKLAKLTEKYGYERFTIKGFLCELGPTPKRFACQDVDGKPERSFTYADKR